MPTEQPQQPRPGAGTPYRTPRYPVFLLSGAAVGLAVGVGLALYGGGPSVAGPAGVLGYFAAFGVILGALAGGTLAVLVESLLNRRHRQQRRERRRR